MDNLSHTMAGVLLARTGLNRAVRHGTWMIVLGANAPDLDIIAGLNGALPYLHVHRGWTHSFAASPVIAIAPLVAWAWLSRRDRPTPRHWLLAWLLSLAGVVSHHLMDWLNVYGVRLLWPFDTSWYRLDLLYIADLWVWAMLALGLLAPALSSLVSGEIGARRGTGRGAAWFSLLCVAAYIGWRWQTHAEAVAQLESRVYSGEPPRRVTALPGPVNPLRWTGLVETSEAWRVVQVRLGEEFDPESARIFYRPPDSDVIRAVRRSRTGQIFLDFAQWSVWRVVPAPGGDGSVSVFIHDLRFGLPEEGRFVAEFRVDARNRVIREEFRFGGFGRGRP